MPFAFNDPLPDRELLLQGLKLLCESSGLKVKMAGQDTTPATNLVVENLNETRNWTRTICSGKETRQRFWRVQLDIPNDEISGGKRTETHAPKNTSAIALLDEIFNDDGSASIAARNNAGIYGARLASDPDSRDDMQFTNPHVLECHTLTYLE